MSIGGEPTTREERREIGRSWNAEPMEMYASTEAGLMAFECKEHTGLHLIESELFLACVDPESGEEVAEGESGRDLVTNLYEPDERPATFVLNYSHGDHVRMIPGGCSCSLDSKLIDHPWRDNKKKMISELHLDEEGQKMERKKQQQNELTFVAKRAIRKLESLRSGKHVNDSDSPIHSGTVPPSKKQVT